MQLTRGASRDNHRKKHQQYQAWEKVDCSQSVFCPQPRGEECSNWKNEHNIRRTSDQTSSNASIAKRAQRDNTFATDSFTALLWNIMLVRRTGFFVLFPADCRAKDRLLAIYEKLEPVLSAEKPHPVPSARKHAAGTKRGKTCKRYRPDFSPWLV